MRKTGRIYEELSITPVINALGHPTAIGGNTPSPAVRAAMEDALADYVEMAELMEVVGDRIAKMLGVEAALVTSGAAAALSVGAAACMTGADVKKIEQLPDTTGMPNEFIIQRQLRVIYDRALEIPGGKLVQVGEADGTRPEHIEAAIGPRTAGFHYLAGGLYDDPDKRTDSVHLRDVIRIAHARGLPVVVDAAGQVYPTERLSKWAQMGADLVAYGAKYFGALNSSGILVGKRELVQAARDNSFIGFEAKKIRAFGRPMKLDRQSVVATYVALREWLTMDHEARIHGYERRLAPIQAKLGGLPGVRLARFPEQGLMEGLRVIVDPKAAKMTAQQVVQKLKEGKPKIWVRQFAGDPGSCRARQDTGDDSFIIRIQTVRESDEDIIADRLKALLAR
jgi:L-seryl-tRNA(Ser) seleniumtransferase